MTKEHGIKEVMDLVKLLNQCVRQATLEECSGKGFNYELSGCYQNKTELLESKLREILDVMHQAGYGDGYAEGENNAFCAWCGA